MKKLVDRQQRCIGKLKLKLKDCEETEAELSTDCEMLKKKKREMMWEANDCYEDVIDAQQMVKSMQEEWQKQFGTQFEFERTLYELLDDRWNRRERFRLEEICYQWKVKFGEPFEFK